MDQDCTCGNKSGYIRDHKETCMLRQPMPRPASLPSEESERMKALEGLVRADHAYLYDLMQAGHDLDAALFSERHVGLAARKKWEDTVAGGGKALAAIQGILYTPELRELVAASRRMVRALENYREAPIIRAGPHPLAEGLEGLRNALKTFP
jgi:hypothetical protein